LSIAEDFNLLVAELTTSTVGKRRNKLRTTADKTNRSANQLIKNAMNTTAKKTFRCPMCPNTYLDRSGLYKHKIRNHPKPQPAANAITVELTNEETATALLVDNSVSTPIGQAVQRSLSEISLSRSPPVPTSDVPLGERPLDDAVLADIHLSNSDTDVVNQILTSSSTVSESQTVSCLSRAVQDIIMHGTTHNWTLPQGLLTSDPSVNKWLNDLSLHLVKTTLKHVSSQMTRVLLEGLASGNEIQKVAELCLRLDNITGPM